MQVHFRWGTRRFDFGDVTERDYFSFHLDDVFQW